MLAPFAALYSYFFGGLQAAATGMALGLSSRGGRFTYVAAFVSAAVVSLIAGATMMATMDLQSSDAAWVPWLLAVLGVLASLSLRVLFRRVFSPLRDSITSS
jgi:hypothetical protein